MSNAQGQSWIQAVWLPSSSWMIPAGFSRWEVAGSADFCCVFNRRVMLRVVWDGPVYWTNFRFVPWTGILSLPFICLGLLSLSLIQAEHMHHSCSLLNSVLLWVSDCLGYWRLAGFFYLPNSCAGLLNFFLSCILLWEDGSWYPYSKSLHIWKYKKTT